MSKVILATFISIFAVLLGCADGYKPTISVAQNVNIIPDNVTPSTTIDVITPDSTIQVEKKPVTIRDSLQKVFLSFVGVREATGRNDGAQVERFLRSVGLGKGYAWCSAFVFYCFMQVGVHTTITAWSPSAENKKNIIYKNGKFKREPLPGDVGTLYYQSLGRIGHAFFYYKRHNDKMYKSVEGNTNGEGSRDGDGVYIRIRAFRATNSISNWIR